MKVLWFCKLAGTVLFLGLPCFFGSPPPKKIEKKPKKKKKKKKKKASAVNELSPSVISLFQNLSLSTLPCFCSSVMLLSKLFVPPSFYS